MIAAVPRSEKGSASAGIAVADPCMTPLRSCHVAIGDVCLSPNATPSRRGIRRLSLLPAIVRHDTGRRRRRQVSSQICSRGHDRITTAAAVAVALRAQPELTRLAAPGDDSDVVAALPVARLAALHATLQQTRREPR